MSTKALRIIKYVLLDIYYLVLYYFNPNKYQYKEYDRVLILGAGRSLLNFNWEFKSSDLIILLNGVGEDYDIPGDYDSIWLIEDKKAWSNYKESVCKTSKIAIVPQDIYTNCENIKAIPFIRSTEFINNWFYSKSLYFWGGTVAYLALQIAKNSKVQCIHLAGIDMYKSENYRLNYYGKNKTWNAPVVDRMLASMTYILKKLLSHGIVITSESNTFDHIGLNK